MLVGAKKGFKTFDKIAKQIFSPQYDDPQYAWPIEFVLLRIWIKFARKVLKKAWAKRKRPDRKLLFKVSVT